MAEQRKTVSEIIEEMRKELREEEDPNAGLFAPYMVKRKPGKAKTAKGKAKKKKAKKPVKKKAKSRKAKTKTKKERKSKKAKTKAKKKKTAKKKAAVKKKKPAKKKKREPLLTEFIASLSRTFKADWRTLAKSQPESEATTVFPGKESFKCTECFFLLPPVSCCLK